MTLVSMTGGSAWSCASNICATANILQPGASYPTITVTASVASYALSPEINQVSVAGGGSPSNSGSDPTTIVAPDFTITLTPTSPPATVMVGGSTTFTVAVSPINAFNGAVTLSAPGLPTGAAAFFSPATITGSGTSTLTITAPASGTGNFTVTANGLSGSLTHNAAGVLAVQDYTLTLSPYSSASPPTIPSGGTQTFTIGAAGLNGFTGNIALGLSPYNLNGNPTCNFSNLSLPSSVAAGSAVTVTLEPNSTYCFFQINGAVNGDIHILNGAVYVSSAFNFNFALPASQGTLTATPTTQASTVVFDPILTSVNNFCGTIDFQVSGLPTGVTATAPPVSLCANSPLTVPITITVPPGTPPGTSQLTINASGAENNAGQASNQYIYPYLQVGSGGSTFSLSVSPPQTTAPGGTAQYTVTVNGSSGLGNVILTATGGAPGSTVLFNGSASYSVLVGGSATLIVATPANEGLGTYSIPITGMMGTVPKYNSAALT
ncbi:MAG TPA: hypothetical protein VMQ86_18465, partial [Bryobacteraceae bacterium]|nr:hypothetical protein [Bryobacteraceae bacterium]